MGVGETNTHSSFMSFGFSSVFLSLSVGRTTTINGLETTIDGQRKKTTCRGKYRRLTYFFRGPPMTLTFLPKQPKGPRKTVLLMGDLSNQLCRGPACTGMFRTSVDNTVN